MNDARDALKAINRNTAEWRAKVIVAALSELPSEWANWIQDRINRGNPEGVRRYLSSEGRAIVEEIILSAWDSDDTA